MVPSALDRDIFSPDSAKNPSFSIPNTRLLQEIASMQSTALDRIDCY